MSLHKANKIIFHILSKLPYAVDNYLMKLDSDEKIIDFINKAIEDVYSQISHHSQFRDEIDHRKIKNQLVNYFVNKINDSRSFYNKFDYETLSSFRVSLRLSKSIKAASQKSIQAEMTTLNKDDAEFFLNAYKNKILALQRMLFQMEKNPNKKAYEQKKLELKHYQDAVEKIKSSESTITILFPPLNFNREITEKQILIIKKMSLRKGNKSVNELNKYILLSELAHKKIKKLAETVNEQHYDMEKIANIAANLSNGFLGKNISKSYLDSLIKKLISKIDINNLGFPLSKQNANLIDSLIHFKKFINESKENINISSDVKDHLNALNLNKLEQLLEDSHKVNNYTHEFKKYSPSTLSNYLTEQEHNFLFLFDKIVTHGGHSTSTERNELCIMLEKTMGNIDFNNRLNLFNKEKNPLASTYRYTISDLKYFGFKTTYSSDSNLFILDKCDKAIKEILQKTKPNKTLQISLYEFGRLNDLAKLKEKMDKYNELGLIKSSSKLSKLYKQVNRAQALCSEIQKQQLREKSFKSGDILMTHSKKSLMIKNKRADNETFLTHTFISKYGHSAQIYMDSETNKPKLSHIYGGYQSDEMTASDMIISDIFRIDPVKLIPEDIQKKLEQFYKNQGMDYKEEVRTLFENSSRNLHEKNQQRFENISNDKYARFQAGLAKFGFYGGHKSTQANAFNEVHQEMYGTDKKFTLRDKMICSEFIGRSLVAALYETNEHLKKKLGEEILFIRIPLEKEKLNRVHPQRLIDLLYKEGCLEKIDGSSFLKKLVNHEDLTKNQPISLKKPGQIFYDELITLAKKYKNNMSHFKIEAVKAFKRYSDMEQLRLNCHAPDMIKFLDENLSQLHQQINDNPNIIVQFFRALAIFLGFKPEAQKIVEKTIIDLERINTNSIKSKYSGEINQKDTGIHVFKSLKAQLPENKENVKIQRNSKETPI